MSTKTTFFVQAFERKRGRLVATTRTDAPTASAAEKRAEALAARAPGAASVCITADAETGEIHVATIMATFGEIPEDFVERLTEG